MKSALLGNTMPQQHWHLRCTWPDLSGPHQFTLPGKRRQPASLTYCGRLASALPRFLESRSTRPCSICNHEAVNAYACTIDYHDTLQSCRVAELRSFCLFDELACLAAYELLLRKTMVDSTKLFRERRRTCTSSFKSVPEPEHAVPCEQCGASPYY